MLLCTGVCSTPGQGGGLCSQASAGQRVAFGLLIPPARACEASLAVAGRMEASSAKRPGVCSLLQTPTENSENTAELPPFPLPGIREGPGRLAEAVEVTGGAVSPQVPAGWLVGNL